MGVTMAKIGTICKLKFLFVPIIAATAQRASDEAPALWR
jgi:hypothetical protein